MWQSVMVRQDCETLPTAVHTQGHRIRYAYARAAESRAANESGQDCLAFAHDETRVAFVLCDGVGQSFFGNIAARILSEDLLAWLVSLEPDVDANRVGDSLVARLNDLCAKATAQVEGHPLPALPALVEQVLEQKRRLGSESMFVAARIDDARHVVMAWMGDSRLRLFTANGESEIVPASSFRTEQRWSTHRGIVRGPANLVVYSLDAPLERVMAYSDGLPALDAVYTMVSDGDLQSMIMSAWLEPKSDDVSFIEVTRG